MKNKKKKYIATVAEVLLAASVTFGALTGVCYLSGKALVNIIEYVGNNYINDNQIDMGNNEFENYLQISEIESIAKELNFDLSLCSNIVRLKHNNGEPVYVSISDKFSDNEKAEIIMALDYIFGFLNAINSNYNYKVVDSVSEAEKMNKSVIKFEVEDMDYRNKCSYLKKGAFIEGITTKLSSKYLDENKDKDMFVYNEVLDGIYKIIGIKKESEIRYENICDSGYFSPNDYKMFMSIYAENFKTKEDKENYIENAKKIIDYYSQEYYKIKYEQEIQRYLEYGYSQERIEQIFSPIDKNVDVVFSNTYNANMTNVKDNTKTTYKISLSIKDGIYKIANYDQNNRLIDTCEGKVFCINGTYYLQDVILDRFMSNKLTCADIQVLKDDFTKGYNIDSVSRSTIASDGKQVVSEFENQNQMQ